MMNKNKKRLLLSLCCALVASTFPVALSACGVEGGPSSSSTAPVIETHEGSYYADKADGEGIYEIAFTEDGRVTYSDGENNYVGTYAKSGKNFVIAFDGNTTATAELVNGKINFKFGNVELTLLEKTEVTVTFNVDGATTKVTKFNGQQVAAPEAPQKAGHKFAGWYTDQKYTKPYVFTTPVTKSITLYARFIEVDENAETFTVNFVVDGVAYGEPVQTEAGIVAELPTPTKEGATFAGWWMSGTNEETKLTAKYDGQIIQENITLFAVWESDAPAVSVSEKGIVWTAAGQNNNYKVSIKKPDGTVKELNLADNYYDYDFAAEAAGEYVVTVTLNGKATTMYYQNKKLAKIAKMEMVEGATWTLAWNEIKNAEKYLVTIECGDAGHQHTQVEVTDACYDFSNCTMQKGGIKIVVEAVAAGYTSSTADAFYYSQDLVAVTNVQVANDQTLTWTAVENAESYKVEITAGDKTETVTLTETSYSLENYTGALTFKVTPYAKGYNAPDAVTATYTKVSLAKPTGVKLTEQTVSWDEMAGATGYTVKVDGKEYTTTETTFDLLTAEIDSSATSCNVQVMATGATAAENSVYSDAITVTFGKMADTLTFRNGKVYWDPVINVTQYAVQLNDGTMYRVDKSQHSYEFTFTSAGEQKIAVRCYDANGVASDWVYLTVTTAEATFDAQEGKDVAPVYQVIGSEIALPEATREGYTFDGWYDAPNGAGGNPYTNYTMGAEGANFFAHWTANTYKIVMYPEGGSLEKTEVEVTYDQLYKLEVPTHSNTSQVFVGWYSEKNGIGFQYTDYTGASLNEMNQSKALSVYAHWMDAFEYTLDPDGAAYSIKMKTGVDAYTKEVTVPVEYEGIPVTRIEADAFKYADFTTINIPDTIKEIFVGDEGLNGTGHAFYGNYYLQNVNIYHVEGNNETAYASIDGVLYKVSALDAEVQTKELLFLPRGKTYYGELATYTVPEGVTHIGTGSFYAAKIAKLILPASLKSINRAAFKNSDIKEFEFAPTPEGQEAVGLIVGDNAFQGCDLLTQITLPARMEKFGVTPFAGCSDLTAIYVEAGNALFTSTEDGVLLNGNGTELVYFPLGRGNEYRIPVGVTSIAASAFTSNKNITSIIIPNYVTYIGKEAFKSCTSLTSLTFEGTETDLPLVIAESAFYSCTNLTEVTLPANLGELQKHAFGQTSSLKTVTMNTTEILEGKLAEKAFGTTAASSVYYVEKLTLGPKVKEFDIAAVVGSKVEAVDVAKGNPYIIAKEGVLYDTEITRIIFYPHARVGAYVTPETLTSIGANVFKGHKYLTSVTIGKNVTEIGNYAFASCSKLTEIIFEAGSEEELVLGTNVFMSTAITSINVPARITKLPVGTFQGCGKLTEVTLPETLTSIGNQAFQNCSTLVNLHIPASVTEIGSTPGSGAFYLCAKLSNLTVAEENTTYAAIGGVLYEKDENGKVETLLIVPRGVTGVVTIPDTVNEIAAKALYMNETVTEVVFGTIEGDLTIGDQAFYWCEALKKVTLPEGLTAIGNSMFYYCQSLEEVIVPSTVASIGNKAFGSCASLTTITFAPTPEGQEEVPLVFEDAEDATNSTFYNCKKLTNFVFPERTVKIGKYAFGRYSGEYGVTTEVGLTKVHIPANVEEIGEYAFYYAPLTELTFAEGSKLTTISNYAFYNTQITEVTIPEGVETIGTEKAGYGGAFAYNYKLKKVNLPSTLKELNGYAFNNCSALEEVNFPNGCNLTVIGNRAFNTCKPLKKFAIPATIEYIGDYAFGGCAALEEVTFAVDAETGKSNLAEMGQQAFQATAITKFVFPETVEAITFPSKNMNIFNGCKQLKEVHLSSTVTNIENMFVNCPALVLVTVAEGSENFKTHATLPIITNLNEDAIRYIYGNIEGEFVIPEGYQEIADRAFEGQQKMTKVVIPASMMTIGNYAFYNCGNLKTVEFAEDSKLTEMGTYVFENCVSLKEITLPDSLTTIGNYTFSKCTALEKVTLGAEVTALGTYVFSYCSSLKTIDLPETLTTIGTYAFRYSGLEEIAFPKSFNPSKVSESTYLFQGCESLKKVTFHEEYKIITNQMFRDCTALEEIKIPMTATEIGTSAFQGCIALNKVDLTDCVNLTKVNGSAFAQTSSLKNISFADCTSLVELGASVFASSTTNTGTTTEKVYVPNVLSGLESIVLPDTITKVGVKVFSYCENLTTVNIPKNLTALGNNMFEGCKSLKSIDLPEGLTFLGKETFSRSGLEKVTIPSTVTQLGSAATTCKVSTTKASSILYNLETNDCGLFWQCENLTEVTLPKTLTKIAGRAFDGCINLTTINNLEQLTMISRHVFRGTQIEELNLPNITNSAGSDLGAGAFSDMPMLKSITIENVQRLSNYAFMNCTALESINLPNIGTKTTAASYGTYAFQNCTALKEVTLDTNLKYITNYMFDGCTALESITLPTKLTTIGSYAFRNSGLKTVDIPSLVTKVDTYAFNGSALESVNIPAKLTTIGNVAFGGCENLAKFTVDAANTTYSVVSGALVKGATLVAYPAGAAYVNTLTLPEGTVIGAYAFYGCDNIGTVVVPDGTESIASYAFSNFLGKEIVLPESVTTFNTYAFQYTSNLEKINIPSGVTKLPSYVFRGTGLETIEIPETVTDMSGTYIFAESNLKSIVIPDSVTKMAISATTYTYTFSNCANLESVRLPSSLTVIYPYMFQGCTSLKTIELPEGITTINTYAFQYSGLTEITIPASVVGLGNYAFRGCESLTKVVFAEPEADEEGNVEGLKTLSNYCFGDCTALKEVTLSSTITTIGDGAFQNSGLTEWTVPATVTNIKTKAFMGSALKNITFTNGYVTLGTYLFQDCTALENIEFPEGMTSLPGYIFQGCTALKSVKLPSTMESIGYRAFLDCAELESVNIPELVNNIGYEAFMNSTKLKSVIVPAGVTTIGRDVFNGWTAEQTVYFLGEEGDYRAYTSFSIEWNDGCEAKIVWNYQPETETETETESQPEA